MGRKGARAQGKAMPEPELSENEDDKVIDDAFAAGKRKVSLVGSADSEEIDEEAVYDLSDSSEGSESEEDDEDGELDDEDPDLDEEIERGGRAGRLAKQAKYLEERLKLDQKEDDDGGDGSGSGGEGDGDGGGDARARLWGASKRAYYGGDDAEDASDEDALREEEEEAARLQAAAAARLDDDDYGLVTGDAGDAGDAGAAAAAAKAAKAAAKRGAGRGGRRGVEVEAVRKDLSALGAEERMSALLADAPELTSLLSELSTSLDEARHRVGPLLSEVREGGLATPEGLAYLQARQLALLQYAAAVTAYLLLKAEGRSVRNHPVIARLVQLRGYLERLAPIDKTLAYQVDKLLRATELARAATEAEGGAGAAAGALGGGEEGRRRRQQQQEQEEEEGEEQQRPAAAEAEAEAARRDADARRRKAKKRKSLAKQMAVGVDGGGGGGAAGAAAALVARQRAEAMRGGDDDGGGGGGSGGVALSRQEAKRLKAHHRAGLARGLGDFEDDVAAPQQAGAVPGGAGGGGGLTELFGRQRLSQKFGADMSAQLRAGRGGDDDLPARDPLHERRARYDAVAARRAAAEGGGDDDDGYDYEAGPRKRRAEGAGGGDDFYAASAAARAVAKADRRARGAAPVLLPPLPDPSVEGQRPISYAIQKNRGLTPHRRKDLKNPRKKHRIKFQAAQVRRKGQVQGVREAPGSGYAGEATGVKANIAKSRVLG
ncbi:MAG: Sas10 C-terminal domain-containing protein [Monoraphidium minutum]|nr:MAG: Sas10 C-terminal domain-containing protein [Monoraphidium minutum]